MEKRKYHRYLLVIDIEHKLENQSQNDSQSSQSKDISEGGMCITTIGFPLEQDQIYSFNFTLPGQLDPIKVKGQVVWNRKAKSQEQELFDNGIEFVDIDDAVIESISEFSIGTVDK